jgi:hypothetical protein
MPLHLKLHLLALHQLHKQRHACEKEPFYSFGDMRKTGRKTPRAAGVQQLHCSYQLAGRQTVVTDSQRVTVPGLLR